MRATRKVPDRARERDRAHRQAAGDGLREAQEIGRDTVLLEREHRPGAAEAGLHLVEDQERTALTAQTRRLGDELARGRTHTALALHELDDERRGLARDRGVERLRLVEWDVRGAREEAVAAERLAILRPPGRGERAHRLPVEATHRRDDPRPLRRHSRELQRALDRFRAAVAEEVAVELGRKDLREPVVQLGPPVVVEELGARRESARLLRDRVGHRAIPMSERRHALATDAVDVRTAILAVERRALAAHDHDRPLHIETRGVGVLASDYGSRLDPLHASRSPHDVRHLRPDHGADRGITRRGPYDDLFDTRLERFARREDLLLHTAVRQLLGLRDRRLRNE